MNRSSRLLLALAMAAASLAAVAHEYTAGALKIAHPWARFTVPGQAAGGAFMTLQNTGSKPDRLLGGVTPVAARVELHSMTMNGGVMKMREMSAVDLPAGQTVVLEPGRMHLMLAGIKAPLQAGTKVPVTLKFEKAGDVQVELLVSTQAPSASASAASSAHRH